LKAALHSYGTSSTFLAEGAKYKAVVAIRAKEEAGNQLKQDLSTAGKQNEAWYFTTGSS
jgi:hypothetical protein